MPETTINHPQTFTNELLDELQAFLKQQEKKFPRDETLTIDLHCHDHNSSTPDELLGRILNIPETWLPSEDLIEILRGHGCDTFTVTNHNNARSCYELRERGIDVLTGAEFTCQVPDYRVGIHVLAYGFTPNQETMLEKLRSDIYRFQEYAVGNDIPTIWAHPLYHYHRGEMPPIEFFEKMALVFERFEVMNGQRDTWQNMLAKIFVDTLKRDNIDALAKKFKIPPDRYCKNPYKKSMAGGSDSHMGIFTGLTGTRLHIEDLSEKLNIMSRSKLALEAIKAGDMAPFGSRNDSEKMTVSFLDYFCQIAMHMEDPGLLRMILHKGDAREKLFALAIANGIAEMKRHRVTMNFLQLFHQCFTGNVPSFRKRIMVPKVYKPIFDEAAHMAVTRRDKPEEIVHKFRDSIDVIYESLSRILIERIQAKIEKIDRDHNLKEMNIEEIFQSFELPTQVRKYTAPGPRKNGNGASPFNLTEFLDGLSFPFLGSAVILSATFASARVMYNSRDLLAKFSEHLGRLKHPHRMLWLTDTLEDVNGVAMVLRSMLDEIRKRDLPIDILVCSSTLKSEDHLIVVPPLGEYTFPFYEQQPLRVPSILDIHRIFKEGEYDRLICSTEGPMGLISLFLKQAYTVPAYFFVHTDWMMFARQVLNFDHENRSRLRRILRAFYQGFDGLFVLNRDQRNWLIGRDMGFDESRVFLTAHWTDDVFVPRKVKKSALFGVPEKSPVLLFAGRVSDEKGVMELPAIYRGLREKHPDVKLVIAGKGPKEEELKKAVPDAVFLGWVDHEKLPEVYSAADMLLLPSRFDTFGVVVLEAMSCGLPVTAYNTKGPKDIIENGKNGYLVKTRPEMTSAVDAYLGNAKLRSAFKTSALARAKSFNPDDIIGQMLNDLGLTAGKKPRARRT
jgi:glycosyltransferase involved in cell wall biosynthesis